MIQLNRYAFRLRASLVAALFATTAMACDGQPEDVWSPDPEAEPILADLGAPIVFDIGPSDEQSGSFAAAQGTGPYGSADVSVGIEGGLLELWAPGQDSLVLTKLEVAVAPIELDAAVVPPEGARLTGVVARLERPVSVPVTDRNDSVVAISQLELVVSWQLERDGQSLALSDLVLRKVPFSLELSRNALGQLRARLVAFRDGIFWSWAGAMSLADLTVDLAGAPAVD